MLRILRELLLRYRLEKAEIILFFIGLSLCSIESGLYL
jgi:hypothetical protein